MHPLYTPHPSLRPAVFERDELVHTTLAMRAGRPQEFGVLWRTFQWAEVRTWSTDGAAIAALVAWVRVHPWALERIVGGDVSVLDELDPYQLHLGPVLVVCEVWTAVPGVVYRLWRALAKEPDVEWMVGRRGTRWRSHRVGRRNGTDVQRGQQAAVRIPAGERIGGGDEQPVEHA